MLKSNDKLLLTSSCALDIACQKHINHNETREDIQNIERERALIAFAPTGFNSQNYLQSPP